MPRQRFALQSKISPLILHTKASIKPLSLPAMLHSYVACSHLVNLPMPTQQWKKKIVGLLDFTTLRATHSCGCPRHICTIYCAEHARKAATKAHLNPKRCVVCVVREAGCGYCNLWPLGAVSPLNECTRANVRIELRA
jgi:hypothetical protein